MPDHEAELINRIAAELRVVFRAARTVAADSSDVFDLARFRVARGSTVVQQV